MTTRVLHIGYGVPPIWEGGELYKISLMNELSLEGWEVIAFLAGRYDFRIKPYLKYSSNGMTRFIELRNSPNPHFQINPKENPLTQCRNELIENFTQKVLEDEKPKIVHIHDLKPFTLSIIDLIVHQGIPVVKTAHSYWDICPQGSLLYSGEERCFSFEDGKKCSICLQNRKEVFLPPLLPIRPIRILSDTKIYPLLKKWWRQSSSLRQMSYSLKKAQRWPHKPESYACRRSFSVERLNKLSFLLCPKTMGEVFVSYGVEREKIYPLLFSAEGLDRIFPKPFRGEKLPITFGFFGGLDRRKGFDVLIRAFRNLEKDKAKLLIYGIDISPARLQDNIELRHYFSRSELSLVLSEIDIGIVPSLSDPCPAVINEFLRALIPVIGSNCDGIPDLLKGGKYGALCQPGNAADLSEKMNIFITQPELIGKIQREIKLPRL